MLKAFFQRSMSSAARKESGGEKRTPRDGHNFGRVGSMQQMRPKPAPPSPEPGQLARAKTDKETRKEARGSSTRRSRERHTLPPSPPANVVVPEPMDPFTPHAPQVNTDPIALSGDRLDKLLDTLTTRELQLSMRIDRADEAVAVAKSALRDSPRGSAGYDGARSRALAAARKRRALENSLAVTTQQSDCVLRALGARGFVSTEERLETRVMESRQELEEATAEAEYTAQAFMTSFGGDIGPDEHEQIAREVEEHLHTPPQLSEDWVKEARMKETENVSKHSREERPGRGDRAQDHIDPRVQFGAVVVEGMGTGVRRRQKQGENGEHRVSTEKSRVSLDRIRSKIPKAPSFSRRKRSEKRR